MVPSAGADRAQQAVTAEARVRDVVRAVVDELAPDERAVVDGLVSFDDATVVRRLRRRRRRRQPLGFGVGEVAVLVTAIVWLVLDEAAKQAAGSVAGGVATRLRSLLRKLFRRPTPPVVITPLSRDQLADVQQRVLDAATRAGLSEQSAQAIADAVVASLALGSPGEDARTPVDDGSGNG